MSLVEAEVEELLGQGALRPLPNKQKELLLQHKATSRTIAAIQTTIILPTAPMPALPPHVLPTILVAVEVVVATVLATDLLVGQELESKVMGKAQAEAQNGADASSQEQPGQQGAADQVEDVDFEEVK